MAAPDYDKLNADLDKKMDGQIEDVKRGIVRLQCQNVILIEALRDCLEYFKDEFDIDNDGGPNKPMRLAHMIEDALSYRNLRV